MLNMQYDQEFLLKLDKSKNKTIYARITSLKFDESPIETIEGRVTGGSINIDGASALRRSCSLTIVAQDFDYNDYYWGLNTKFKLEVGVQNYVDPQMPDIIWFKQGIYLITSFNTSRSTNNFTISISGKDKMCLLNGEVGGSLEASVDFGTIEEEDKNGVWTIRPIPIPEIIRNAVHTYAGEPYWNIIINDLDTYGLELLEYRYDTPLYLYKAKNSNLYYNVILENDYTTVYLDSAKTQSKKLSELTIDYLDPLVNALDGGNVQAKPVYSSTGEEFYFAKVEFGQTAGYRVTDLTYAGDLIANIGESITSILDKIKNMLVEFEYFYDLDGRFVFQKKQSFVSTMWQPLSTNSNGEVVAKTSSPLAYTFTNGDLITAFNNNPNLLNMRNDYSIWGERTGVSGAKIPVHMRYAIDRKPEKYVQITVDDSESKLVIDNYNLKHGTTLRGRPEEEVKTFIAANSDWREVMYQMALDYYKYNILDDFELRLREANPEYFTGQTGYEKYYIDLQGFWRQLYDPEINDDIAECEKKKTDAETSVTNLENSIKAKETEIINTHKAGNDVTALKAELQSLEEQLDYAELEVAEMEIKLEKLQARRENFYDNGDRIHWNKDVYESPETLNFWFEFLDTEGELSQFSVKNVGSRSKAVNDTAIKSIYFRETPAIIYTTDITIEEDKEERQLSGYRYIQIPEEMIDTMFSISAQGKSAKDKLDELLYQHGYCIESATITAIPIYYLQPNTRVHLHDDDTNLDGDYVVSKITLPLTYNGTMSLTATKAAESIF